MYSIFSYFQELINVSNILPLHLAIIWFDHLRPYIQILTISLSLSLLYSTLLYSVLYTCVLLFVSLWCVLADLFRAFPTNYLTDLISQRKANICFKNISSTSWPVKATVFLSDHEEGQFSLVATQYHIYISFCSFSIYLISPKEREILTLAIDRYCCFRRLILINEWKKFYVEHCNFLT